MAALTAEAKAALAGLKSYLNTRNKHRRNMDAALSANELNACLCAFTARKMSSAISELEKSGDVIRTGLLITVVSWERDELVKRERKRQRDLKSWHKRRDRGKPLAGVELRELVHRVDQTRASSLHESARNDLVSIGLVELNCDLNSTLEESGGEKADRQEMSINVELATSADTATQRHETDHAALVPDDLSSQNMSVEETQLQQGESFGACINKNKTEEKREKQIRAHQSELFSNGENSEAERLCAEWAEIGEPFIRLGFEFAKTLIRAYENVDMIYESRKIAAWWVSNPLKRPKKNVRRFLNSWLARTNESASVGQERVQQQTQRSKRQTTDRTEGSGYNYLWDKKP